MKQNDLLPRIKAEVERVSPGAEIIVYGSVARGEATEDSDIDLLIVINKGTRLYLRDTASLTEVLNNLEFETGIPISPLIKSRYEWENLPFRTPFFCNVMNEGIRL